MIVYSSTKAGFISDFEHGTLVSNIYNLLAAKLRRTGRNEIQSWQNSLAYMCNAIRSHKIPDDVGVAIEYIIPNTQKRVDFIITGTKSDEVSNQDKSNAIVIELKQWSEAECVDDKENVVKTIVGRSVREVTHPCYQSWSYCQLIKDFNQAVQDNKIGLYPCAYLHNYVESKNDDLRSPIYNDIIEKSPLFTTGDMDKLRTYVHTHIDKGDKNKSILQTIEFGRLRPAKSLQDSIASMMDGNQEFTLIDEQKVVYESILAVINKAVRSGKKHVCVIQGGPGTGKSVISVNLLAECIKRGLMAQYVTRNSAPRDVYLAKLKGRRRSVSADEFFKGSGSYVNCAPNSIDVLIADEAHRLSEKSGMFYNQGEDQVKEIINASVCSVFFIDDRQRVTIKDKGSSEKIRRLAEEMGAVRPVYEDVLESQFRCNGSDGYLAWLDHLLEIRDTANYDGFEHEYDFQVFSDPKKMREAIIKKNAENGKARMVAGYCWEWSKAERNNTDYHDIKIPEYNFEISWNLDRSTFALDNKSINEVGCIHTTQGLEFDYIGVIIGDDMRYENGRIITDFRRRAISDASLKRIKKLAEVNPEEANKIADEIIKNTYRTLMTRGQKGCYVFCTDTALAEHIRKSLPHKIIYGEVVEPQFKAAEGER